MRGKGRWKRREEEIKVVKIDKGIGRSV